MATSQFVTFAATALNALTPSSYAASPLRASGHVPGIALSEVVNTTFRQTSTMSAALAKFVADNQAADVLDDGNSDTIGDQIRAAVEAVIATRQFWQPGDLKSSARNADQTGWLWCNGAIVNRVTYAALFAAIGTSFNQVGVSVPGDSFQIPDFRGLVIRGFDGGRGVDPSRVFGAEQLDAFQNFIGYFGVDDRIANNSAAIGAVRSSVAISAEAQAAGAPTIDTTASGGDGQTRYAKLDPSQAAGTRTATETRMRNNTARILIKT